MTPHDNGSYYIRHRPADRWHRGREQAPAGSAAVVEENEDGSVLCDLCVQAGPAGQVRVIKLYEG